MNPNPLEVNFNTLGGIQKCDSVFRVDNLVLISHHTSSSKQHSLEICQQLLWLWVCLFFRTPSSVIETKTFMPIRKAIAIHC